MPGNVANLWKTPMRCYNYDFVLTKIRRFGEISNVGIEVNLSVSKFIFCVSRPRGAGKRKQPTFLVAENSVFLITKNSVFLFCSYIGLLDVGIIHCLSSFEKKLTVANRLKLCFPSVDIIHIISRM